MSMVSPFEDSASVELGDLTIENGAKRIAIYGSIGLTRDKAGLADARELRDLFNEIVRVLESDKQLPDEITPSELLTVDNPFA